MTLHLFALVAEGASCCRCIDRVYLLHLVVRDADGAAFVDQYALMQWLGILVLVILARGLWKVAGRDVPESPLSLTISQEGFFALGDTLPSRIVPLLWVGAGFLLGGVLDKYGWGAWTWMIIPFSVFGALLMTRLWNETPLRKAHAGH